MMRIWSAVASHGGARHVARDERTDINRAQFHPIERSASRQVDLEGETTSHRSVGVQLTVRVSGKLIIPHNVSKTGRDANCERFCLVLEFRLRSEQASRRHAFRHHGQRPSGNQRPATSRASA